MSDINKKNKPQSDSHSENFDKISSIEKKLDIVISALEAKPKSTKYLTAQMIEKEFGIDQRTILNRSNLPPSDKRYIPSLKMNGRRKYFERKVINRLLNPAK